VSLHEVTGLTVPPNDARALAGALNRLFEDVELARRFGARGRERALERFTAERMVDETLALYRDITATSAVTAVQVGLG